MKKILFISLLCWTTVCTQAQCDKNLLDKATENAGANVVLMRDFKANIEEASRRNPLPSVKYSLLLQKNIQYQFNWATDSLQGEKPLIQLFDHSNLLKSSWNNQGNIDSSIIHYRCDRTGNYQLVISILSGKAACVAAVMSIEPDSALPAHANQ